VVGLAGRDYSAWREYATARTTDMLEGMTLGERRNVVRSVLGSEAECKMLDRAGLRDRMAEARRAPTWTPKDWQERCEDAETPGLPMPDENLGETVESMAKRLGQLADYYGPAANAQVEMFR